MDVNADFSQRVVLDSESMPWQASPMPGVDRRRLDRVDNADDRVTTIVRYAPGSHFSAHVHTGGEEFVVLDGVFEDEYGDWPTGSYVRNPPQSKHTPGSRAGCTILVKLAQFAADDRTFVHANRYKLGAVGDRERPGVRVSPLFEDERESVRFEHWDASTRVEVDATGGCEVFVLQGEAREGDDTLRRHAWLRSPVNTVLQFVTGPEGAVVWVKSGHLRFV